MKSSNHNGTRCNLMNEPKILSNCMAFSKLTNSLWGTLRVHVLVRLCVCVSFLLLDDLFLSFSYSVSCCGCSQRLFDVLLIHLIHCLCIFRHKMPLFFIMVFAIYSWCFPPFSGPCSGHIKAIKSELKSKKPTMYNWLLKLSKLFHAPHNWIYISLAIQFVTKT